ncbi:MAG: PQQ-like beta-propeller repeat protein [Prolixibacteraceae bacterium]|nr:PQQ-like beta-propeller repeat protein [Prolixibacteraceae bacterium]MBN2773544.1 PQQ-like beta-propeller repeat protein [Prolixibacteraceae bacterium]
MKQLTTLNLKNSHLLIFIFIIVVFNQSCKKQEMSQWRGVDRFGHYDDVQIADEWPENGPEMLWVTEGIGNGFAAPVILNDIIFVNGEIDSISYLFAFDLNGNLLWKSPNGPEFMGEGFSSTYPGARSAPTVIKDLVYTSSGMGRIACFDANTGDEVWAVDLVKELGGTDNYFGYSESVVVDDQKVYCFPGGNKNNVAAFDRLTGNIVWTSEALRDTFAYCSPIQVDLGSKKVWITTSRHHLFSVDCETGEVLGTYTLEGYEYDGEHCNSPVYSDGFIYFIANDIPGRGAVKLELLPDGKITEVWSNKSIRNNFHGFIVYENHLLTTIEGNWLKALSLENGVVTDSVKIATGSIIEADNKLICYGANGDLNLVKFNNNKFEVSSKFKVDKGTKHHFSYPVLAKGIMYIRHGDALIAYNLK